MKDRAAGQQLVPKGARRVEIGRRARGFGPCQVDFEQQVVETDAVDDLVADRGNLFALFDPRSEVAGRQVKYTGGCGPQGDDGRVHDRVGTGARHLFTHDDPESEKGDGNADQEAKSFHACPSCLFSRYTGGVVVMQFTVGWVCAGV